MEKTKKNEDEEKTTTVATTPAAAPAPAMSPNDIMSLMNNLALMQQSSSTVAAMRKQAKDMEAHKFWSTQPVPKNDEDIVVDGPIEEDVPKDQLRQEPYALPKDFEWFLVDINDENEMKDLYELLTFNYVEDDDAQFRFDYSAEFLKWALQPPGWKKEWHLGVRVISNRKLVGFISGIPAHMRMRTNDQIVVEINFLCVIKKLRSKRLAPVLIKEITRRVNLEGIYQAVYTAGVILPKPIGGYTYFHRNLNPKKLVDVGFSHLGRNMTIARMTRLYKMPESTTSHGMRPMEKSDVAQVTSLLNAYLAKFEVAPIFSEADVAHWFLPTDGVVNSYVTLDPTTNKVDQFVSFYALPSSVLKHEVHKKVYAGYLYYYVPRAAGADEKALLQLIKDALSIAQKLKFDVFNCLDLMQNTSFLEELKFGRGDGNLQYYFYNYRFRRVDKGDMGLVML